MFAKHCIHNHFQKSDNHSPEVHAIQICIVEHSSNLDRFFLIAGMCFSSFGFWASMLQEIFPILYHSFFIC